jgi:hypothetical protein
MDLFPEDIETDLLDLTEIPISDLRVYDDDLLTRSMRRILSQVERPRANIGQGPPGRAD